LRIVTFLVEARQSGGDGPWSGYSRVPTGPAIIRGRIVIRPFRPAALQGSTRNFGKQQPAPLLSWAICSSRSIFGPVFYSRWIRWLVGEPDVIRISSPLRTVGLDREPHALQTGVANAIRREW